MTYSLFQALTSFSAALQSGQLGPLMNQFNLGEAVANSAAQGGVCLSLWVGWGAQGGVCQFVGGVGSTGRCVSVCGWGGVHREVCVSV